MICVVRIWRFVVAWDVVLVVDDVEELSLGGGGML